MAILINTTRPWLHWLSSSMFIRDKYRNISHQLKNSIFKVFIKTSIFGHACLLQNRNIAAKIKLVFITAFFSKLGRGKGYPAYLVDSYPMCNLVRSNKATVLNSTCVLKKQDSICTDAVLTVSYLMSPLYFRLYKQRGQLIMLYDKPPDKLHSNSLINFHKSP